MKNRDKSVHKCPHCGADVNFKTAVHKPFCSRRCKLADLGTWLREEYTVSSWLYTEDEAAAPETGSLTYTKVH